MAEDLRRYLDVLREIIGHWDGSKRAIERRLGWASGRLTKLLSGQNELRVESLLEILAVIGVDPMDFYQTVHGEATVSEKILRKLSMVSPRPEPRISPSISEEELVQRIEAAVERAFAAKGRKA
jgi:hypothetical protein